MELLTLFWLGCAVASAVVASSKGRSFIGWGILGFLLGPFALLGIAIVGPDQKRRERAGLQSGQLRRCPACAETVQRDAIKCRHCGELLPAAPKSQAERFGEWLGGKR